MKHFSSAGYQSAVAARPRKRRRALRALFLALASCLFLSALGFFVLRVGIPAARYSEAARMVEQKEYLAASQAFLRLGNFSDAPEQAAACYAALVGGALAESDLDAAVGYLREMETRGLGGWEELYPAFYAYASERADGGSYRQALRIFDEVIPGYLDGAARAEAVRYRLGMEQYEQRHYQNAYEIFAGLDELLCPGAEEAVGMAKQARYDELVALFLETGAVPDGFNDAMLDGFADTGLYRGYRRLTESDWGPEDYEENIRLVYELGDFMDTAGTGFVFRRVYGHRFTNEAGGYLEMTEDGTIDSNLPQFFYSGYYGLYSKMEGNIYYIGSDEVLWSKQFRLTLGDGDRTLWVYCYSTGSTYQLSRES